MGCKISIIMTTMNVEQYIAESMACALRQSIGELELLCVDGHSTDHTLDIIRDYAKKDPRVKLLFQERPGIGAAKNCGIEHAQGEYLTFLDADDWFVDDTALQKMYDACQKQKVKVCGALRSVRNMDGTFYYEPLHRAYAEGHPEGVRLLYRDWQYDYHFHSYLYDTSMVQASEARFGEIKAYDDTWFFIRAMLAAEEFYVLPIEYYRYRGHPAYTWGEAKTRDAIRGLTGQLELTRKNGLAYAHWLAYERISYEYRDVILNNIRQGAFDLVDLLAEANRAVDPALMDQVQSNPPPRAYTEAMLYRTVDEVPVFLHEDGKPFRYVIGPLQQMLQE